MQEHASAVLRAGGSRHWQWPLTITAWLLEQAGIVDLLRKHPEHAEELLAEARISAAAR